MKSVVQECRESLSRLPISTNPESMSTEEVEELQTWRKKSEKVILGLMEQLEQTNRYEPPPHFHHFHYFSIFCSW